jgi:hypothetical protein
VGRLTGLGSFILITGGVLLVLRLLHVGIPLLLPDTRPGPFALTSLDEVRRRVGFAPLVPAYRPAALGDRPSSLTVSLSPYPTFVIVWRGEHHLSVTQRRGGAMPAHPATGQPLAGVAGSTWWRDGSVHRLVLKRDEFWIEVETDLPSRDLKRIADTLTPY